MSKKQSFTFLIIFTLIHFGLMLMIISSRLDCGILSHCVSRLNVVAGAVLAFPMGIIMRIIYPLGASCGSWYFIFMFINSFLVAIIIWVFLEKTIFSRKGRVR
jgi:hypothetical protein